MCVIERVRERQGQRAKTETEIERYDKDRERERERERESERQRETERERQRQRERERAREGGGENIFAIPGPEHPEKDGPDHGEEIVGVVGPRLLTLRSALVVQHPGIGTIYTMVFILDGCSFHCTHIRSKSGNSIR